MKKRFLTAAAALCAIAIVFTCSVALAGDTNVEYDGDAQRFVFIPESTDLFENYKGVMPGDVIEQRIGVTNSISNEVKIKLYLRAEPVEAQYEDFLNELTIRVMQEHATILYEGPAGEQGDLAENVYLGTFYSGASTEINMLLNVPIELGNEYMSTMGEIRWVFTVEELPIEPDDPDPPITGDMQRTAFYLGMIALAVVLIAAKLVIDGRAKRSRA
ncbi:MAG: hypothetical protein Q4B99_00710 [Clostridia bacterium]|nr:hypothetical protein [Clostridia bacterium]